MNIDDEEGEEEFYYYNLKSGRSQWDRPVFTLHAPIPHDMICLQGVEDDPASWVPLTMIPGEETREQSVRDSLNPLHGNRPAVRRGPQQ